MCIFLGNVNNSLGPAWRSFSSLYSLPLVHFDPGPSAILISSINVEDKLLNNVPGIHGLILYCVAPRFEYPLGGPHEDPIISSTKSLHSHMDFELRSIEEFPIYISKQMKCSNKSRIQ